LTSVSLDSRLESNKAEEAEEEALLGRLRDPPNPLESNLIRGNLFFFHLMAMKITTQFVLTSNIKAFVLSFSLPSNERKVGVPG